MARSKRKLTDIKADRQRRLAFLSSCERKVRHETRALAEEVARLDEEVFGSTMFVYDCPFCAGFHLAKGKADAAEKHHAHAHTDGD